MAPSARGSPPPPPPPSLCLRCVFSASLSRHLEQTIASGGDASRWTGGCEEARRQAGEVYEEQSKISRSVRFLSERSLEEDSSRSLSFRRDSSHQKRTSKMMRQCQSENCKLSTSPSTTTPISVKSFPASIHTKAGGPQWSPPPPSLKKPSSRLMISSSRYLTFPSKRRGGSWQLQIQRRIY